MPNIPAHNQRGKLRKSLFPFRVKLDTRIVNLTWGNDLASHATPRQRTVTIYTTSLGITTSRTKSRKWQHFFIIYTPKILSFSYHIRAAFCWIICERKEKVQKCEKMWLSWESRNLEKSSSNKWRVSYLSSVFAFETLRVRTFPGYHTQEFRLIVVAVGIWRA